MLRPKPGDCCVFCTYGSVPCPAIQAAGPQRSEPLKPGVRDTGTGISAVSLDRVFDLFVRATSGGNGLGIGLAVAKRLVELHSGTIAVTSEGIGRGSEFTVTLPQPALTEAACS